MTATIVMPEMALSRPFITMLQQPIIFHGDPYGTGWRISLMLVIGRSSARHINNWRYGKCTPQQVLKALEEFLRAEAARQSLTVVHFDGHSKHQPGLPALSGRFRLMPSA